MLSLLVILVLLIVFAAPALLALLRKDFGWRTGSFYAATMIVLVAWHVGLSVGPLSATGGLMRPPVGAVDGTRCEQALTAAERAGIILDRSNPSRLIVRRTIWAEIPEEVRTALAQCVETARPDAAGAGTVEVIER